MALIKSLMFNWNMFSLAFFSMMLSESASMKSSTGKLGTVHEYELDPEGKLPENEMVSKMVYDGIQTTVVKKSIDVASRCQLLDFTIYSPVYQIFKGITGQRQTRLANIKFAWSPTTRLSASTATIICYDTRYKNDGHISSSSESVTTNKKTVTGKIITAITFNPNFQTLIVGSMDFATATKDLHYIKFYISFSESEMTKKATFGFLDITWQTVPGTGQAIQKVYWDVFKFPSVVAPEVKNRSGANFFEYMKRVMSEKYNRDLEIQKAIEDINFQTQFPHDGGKGKASEKITELEGDLEQLVEAAKRHKEAIEMTRRVEELEKNKQRLLDSMRKKDVNEITQVLNEVEIAKAANEASNTGYVYLESDV